MHRVGVRTEHSRRSLLSEGSARPVRSDSLAGLNSDFGLDASTPKADPTIREVVQRRCAHSAT